MVQCTTTMVTNWTVISMSNLSANGAHSRNNLALGGCGPSLWEENRRREKSRHSIKTTSGVDRVFVSALKQGLALLLFFGVARGSGTAGHTLRNADEYRLQSEVVKRTVSNPAARAILSRIRPADSPATAHKILRVVIIRPRDHKAA